MASSDSNLQTTTSEKDQKLQDSAEDPTTALLMDQTNRGGDNHPQHVELVVQSQIEYSDTPPAALPTYDEAMDPASAPPPPYEALFGKVKDVHKESSGTLDFLKNIFLLCCGTLACTTMIGLSMIIPLAMLIVGSIYVHDCPKNKYIPIYLIVGGVFGCLQEFATLCCSHSNRKRNNSGGDTSTSDSTREKATGASSLFSCFMLCWFISGSYWVYRDYKPSFNPDDNEQYCNRFVYLFAFWQITLTYIILGLMICCFCVGSVTLIFCAKKYLEGDEERPGPQTP